MRLLARLFLASLGVAVSCRDGRDARAPEPGTELYAVAPETVREVVFSLRDVKLYAYRWAMADTFHLVIATRGDARVEQCVGGAGFARWLGAVARMPVTRVLGHRVAPASIEWADLRLRDTTQLEPLEVRLGLPSSPGAPTIIEVRNTQYAVDVDNAALLVVKAGCASLGAVR